METPLPSTTPVIPSPFSVATHESGSVLSRIQAITGFPRAVAAVRARDLDEECGGNRTVGEVPGCGGQYFDISLRLYEFERGQTLDLTISLLYLTWLYGFIT